MKYIQLAEKLLDNGFCMSVMAGNPENLVNITIPSDIAYILQCLIDDIDLDTIHIEILEKELKNY
jgi:hypothetical protein